MSSAEVTFRATAKAERLIPIALVLDAFGRGGVVWRKGDATHFRWKSDSSEAELLRGFKTDSVGPANFAARPVITIRLTAPIVDGLGWHPTVVSGFRRVAIRWLRPVSSCACRCRCWASPA